MRFLSNLAATATGCPAASRRSACSSRLGRVRRLTNRPEPWQKGSVLRSRPTFPSPRRNAEGRACRRGLGTPARFVSTIDGPKNRHPARSNQRRSSVCEGSPKPRRFEAHPVWALDDPTSDSVPRGAEPNHHRLRDPWRVRAEADVGYSGRMSLGAFAFGLTLSTPLVSVELSSRTLTKHGHRRHNSGPARFDPSPRKTPSFRHGPHVDSTRCGSGKTLNPLDPNHRRNRRRAHRRRRGQVRR